MKRHILWLGLIVLLLNSAACRLSQNLLGKDQFDTIFKSQDGLIAYVGIDGNIYTANEVGDEVHPITMDAQLAPGSGEKERFYQFPTWSQDGQKLAFIGTTRSNAEIESVSLFIATIGREELIEAYKSNDDIPFYLYWAPNSTQVTFLSSKAGETDLSLQMVSAGQGELQVLGTGQPFYWDWSPDHRRIITHTGGAAATRPDARLTLLELDNGIIESDLDLPPAAFQAPAWSPNGDELLLVGEGEEGQNALTLTDDQGIIKKSLVTSQGAIAFAWSPDGEKLAYLAGASPATQILAGSLKVIDPDEPEQATSTADDQVIAFFWSPNSSQIAYFVPVIETPGEELVQSGDPDSPFKLSLRVLEASTGEAREIALFVPSSQLLNIIPFFDQYQRSDTIWSPDGQRLVYAALEPGMPPGIYVAEASGEASPNRIASGQFAFWSWR